MLLSLKDKIVIDSFLLQYPYRFFAYGSRTKKTSNISSDLDLCIIDPISIEQYAQIKSAASELPVAFSVDISAWQYCNEEFKLCIKNDLVPYIPDLFLNAEVVNLNHSFAEPAYLTHGAQLELSKIVAPCTVIHMEELVTKEASLTDAILEEHENLYGPFISGEWLLIMTGYGKSGVDSKNDKRNFQGITREAIQLLQKRKILGIAIDISFSHEFLLQANIPLLNNIAYYKSSSFRHGYLMVLPLPMTYHDKIPSCVILIKQHSK